MGRIDLIVQGRVDLGMRCLSPDLDPLVHYGTYFPLFIIFFFLFFSSPVFVLVFCFPPEY